MYEKILYDVIDGVATVTLNRPEKLNAYTPEMGEEVVSAFTRAREDEEARVVILTGAGRAFCAGVDLDHLKEHMAGKAVGSGPRLGEESFVREWPLELIEFPKPVIAAVNGAAFGVGVTMTLGCDVRLAASGARFGLNFASLGVLPGLGSTHLLPQLVGMPKALELVLTAATIQADEAERIGLVEAQEMARAMAKCRPEVLAAAKRALRYGASASMAEAMEEERALSTALRGKAAR
jgi:enoyl-CoA hydratase/carnithine racemase